jgi:hypothetical protein
MNSRRVLGAYRCSFCLLILIASVQTLLAGPAAPQVVALAAVEITGALLLLWRRTQWLGLPLLLLVFASAELLAAHSGSWPTRFVQYAASALLIVLLDRSLGGGAVPAPRATAG